MAVKTILQAPNVKLNTRCEEVSEITEDIKKLVKDLKDTLTSANHPQGAGLAAPQVGVTKRVCIVRKFSEDEKSKSEEVLQEYVLINPVITSKSKDTSIWWEACLSINDTYGKVERANKVKVEAIDDNGNPVKLNTGGFLARVIQHEVDHLDGILFTSKVVGEALTEEQLDDLVEKSNA